MIKHVFDSEALYGPVSGRGAWHGWYRVWCEAGLTIEMNR